ncbi:MAG: hypothetical protein IKZ13_03680 [Akkermansia sp.]|nr:hypothetical protein [Akkermansia sp.]
MNQKSITFRCSASQRARLENAMLALTSESRTAFIAAALEDFLRYVEQEDVAALNLFELVQHIDATGNGTSFASQA